MKSQPPPGQRQIAEAAATPKPAFRDDYLGVLPPNVFPIGAEILEQSAALLVIKRYGYKQEITPKQRFIFKLLTRLGEGDLAQGSVTVLCLWGVGDIGRAYARFDYTGTTDPKPTTHDEIRLMIGDWWRTNGRRR